MTDSTGDPTAARTADPSAAPTAEQLANGAAAPAPTDADAVSVFAAGGVVWRTAVGAPLEVLVVHRPRYDDWSFPKGKRDTPDEPDEVCALREVAEETGLVCELGVELDVSFYRDRKGRLKQVRYWTMQPRDAAHRPADDEVDELRWLSIDKARAALSYARDVPVLDSFVAALAAGRVA